MTFEEWRKDPGNWSIFPRVMIRRAWEAATRAAREECAAVCEGDAARLEEEAQRALYNFEPDEVPAIRAAAHKLMVAAARIRAL
jgi:hypothetical protein